uniref:CSON001336 protein n=1 Tax=Culicoides sonorensis TaxID=179676 RepID=A0A336JWY3_CULSO
MENIKLKILVFCTLIATIIASPVALQSDNRYNHHEPVEDLDAASQYEFAYSVHSEKTGDIKSHEESRDKDGAVKGTYSFIESDGHRRTVKYSVYKDSGFIADVNREEVQGYKASQFEYVKYESPKKSQYFTKPVEKSDEFLIKYQEEPAFESLTPALPSKNSDSDYKVQYHDHTKTESVPVKYKQYENKNPQSFQQVNHYYKEEVTETPTTQSPVNQNYDYETTQTNYENTQKSNQGPVKFQEYHNEEVKHAEKPVYENEPNNVKIKVPAFLKEQQLPKYDSEYKQLESLPKSSEVSFVPYYEYKGVKFTDLPKFNMEQYQTLLEKNVDYSSTQYEQEQNGQINTEQQTNPNQESHKYEKEVQEVTQKPEFDSIEYATPKYEVKYDHIEIKKEDVPQYHVQYVFVQKPIQQNEPSEKTKSVQQQPQSLDQVKGYRTQVAAPVKQYRFSPLEDLYKFVIHKTKNFDGAEPAPDFLK